MLPADSFYFILEQNSIFISQEQKARARKYEKSGRIRYADAVRALQYTQ